MVRVIPSRTATSLAAAILLASLLFLDAGPSLAANTRNVSFGSPGSANGALTFTPTNIGGNTAVDVKVLNNGPQNLPHARVSGGSEAPTAFNALTPPPFTPSLPADLHYQALFVSSASTASANCSLTSPFTGGGWNGLVCDFPSGLAAGQFLQFRVVIGPAAATVRSVYFVAQIDEGSSKTGSNADVFFASGSFTGQAATCTAAPGGVSVANYFLVGQPVDLANGTVSTCPTQRAAIKGPAFNSQGAFASLGVDNTPAPCPAGYASCFGGLVVASVNDGVAGSDAIAWTIRWSSSLYKGKPKGVLHFLDGGGFDVITFNDGGKCPTPTTGTNCWTAFTTTSTYAEVTFRTATNGSAKGF